MADDAPQPRARRARLLVVLDRIPTLVWIAAAALLVVGVVALFGGLEDADATPVAPVLETLPIGEHSGGNPTDVAVLSVTRTSEVPQLFLEADPGEELIIVELDAINTWDRSNVGLRDTVLLEIDGEPVEADRVLVTADLVSVSALPPRVATGMTLIWPVPVGAVGDIATVLVTDGEFVPDPVILDVPYWRDLGPRWMVSVPVEVGTHIPDGESGP